MKHLSYTFFAMLLLVSTGGSAGACSCLFHSVEEQLELSDRVVSGTVESVEILEEDSYEIHRAHVAVNEIFKGAPDGHLVVETLVIGSCTFSLAVNQEYLIYALKTETQDLYETSECQRTRLRSLAGEDIVKLPDPTFAVQTRESSWSSMKSRFDDSSDR